MSSSSLMNMMNWLNMPYNMTGNPNSATNVNNLYGACQPKKTMNPPHKKPPRREWVKKGSQKDHTKTQPSHIDKDEIREGMAIQPPKETIQPDSQRITVIESRGEPHNTQEQGKMGWKGPLYEHNDQLLVTNFYTVLADVAAGNQSFERTHDKILPIKALGAYPIQDHE